MTSPPAGPDRPDSTAGTLNTIRRGLFWVLLLGMLGTGAELLLLGHVEGVYQVLPVALLSAGVIVGLWHAASPGPSSVRTLQGLMLLFVLSGALGVLLHYTGNAEFELEMYPTMDGIELVKKTLTGATPVLAPGTMVVLGLVGLAHAYRHPRLGAGSGSPKEE